jgi:hypothetical protein
MQYKAQEEKSRLARRNPVRLPQPLAGNLLPLTTRHLVKLPKSFLENRENQKIKSVIKKDDHQADELSKVVLPSPRETWKDWGHTGTSDDEKMEITTLGGNSLRGVQNLSSRSLLERREPSFEEGRRRQGAVAKVAELLNQEKAKEKMENEKMAESMAMERSLLETSRVQNLSSSSSAKKSEEDRKDEPMAISSLGAASSRVQNRDEPMAISQLGGRAPAVLPAENRVQAAAEEGRYWAVVQNVAERVRDLGVPVPSWFKREDNITGK